MTAEELQTTLKAILTSNMDERQKNKISLELLQITTQSIPTKNPSIIQEEKPLLMTLSPEEDYSMLINIPGVSVATKPRKDGRFQGYITENGERKYYYGRTLNELTTKIQLFFKNSEQPKIQPKKKNTPLFREYVERWIELYKKPNLKPSSFSSLQSSLRFALNEFGHRPINAITSDNIQNLLLGIKGERIRDLCRINLVQIFNKAVSQGIIKRNPCDAVEIKKHRAEHKQALTKDEQQLFINVALNSNYSLLYRFLLATGLRIGEALALNKNDFNFKECKVTICKNVIFLKGERVLQNTPKTEAGNRILPVPKAICSEIKGVDTEIVFPYTYNAVRLSIQRIAKNTGLNVTLHILRHTYATRLEEAGIPPKIKQYLLGHASLEVTQNIYTDAQREYVDSVSDKVRTLFG